MNVCLVLKDGNDAHATPLAVDFKYCPLFPVAPPAVIVLLNLAFAAKVVTPATLTLSKLV